MAYVDVGLKGFRSLGRMQKMSDIAEQARAHEAQPPEKPSPEMVEAKAAAYRALSVKELRAECAGRPLDPRRPEGDEGLPTAGFAEKDDFVKALLASDAGLYEAATEAHSVWVASSMEGPNPARHLLKKRPAKKSEGAKSAPQEGAGTGAEGGEKAEAENAENDDGGGEAAEAMNAAMESSLPVFLETLVSGSLLDVEVTLKAVTKKVRQ